MSDKIFISYRRDDAKAEARSIYQHLQRVYGRDRIFMDVDSIQKGLDFTKVLDQSIKQTGAMLVVIGRTWLNQQDESGRRRLDDPTDYVRLEIASALNRDIPVIPVRVDGARIPTSDELPDDLKALVHRQGTAITHENFDSDLRGLEDDLSRIVAAQSPSRTRPLAIAAIAALVVIGGAGAWLTRTNMSPGPAAAPIQANPTSSDTAAALRAAAAWAEAQRTNTFASYRAFLREHPMSPRRSTAAEAAIPLLTEQIGQKLEAAVASLKRRDGALNGYAAGLDPRAMAMCIEWAGTSIDTFLVRSWGSSQSTATKSVAPDEADKSAMAFCTNSAPDAQHCNCEIVHRNGKPALKIPQTWITQQLR